MAERTAKLEIENAKLKDEIRRLKQALNNISSNLSAGTLPSFSLDSQQSSIQSQPHRRQILQEQITHKLEKGIFSPAKEPRRVRSGSRGRAKEKPSIDRASSKENTHPIHFITSFGEGKEHSFESAHNFTDTHGPKQLKNNQIKASAIPEIEASLESIEYSLRHPEKSKPFKEGSSLQEEIEALRRSMAKVNARLDGGCKGYELSDSLQSYESKDKPSEVSDTLLKDSFGSFYEDSEIKVKTFTPKPNQFNIKLDTSKVIKQNSSFVQEPKKPSDSDLLSEIEKLRAENQLLRARYKNSSPIPQPKLNLDTLQRHTPHSPRRVSRSPSTTSISYTGGRSITPERLRHCKACDHLLSKGYSTKYCSKHGKS